MVRCSNNHFYIGHTNNLKERIKEHNGVGKYKGARYTNAHRPVTLEHFETFQTKSEAYWREMTIKDFSPAEKEVLAANGNKIGYQ